MILNVNNETYSLLLLCLFNIRVSFNKTGIVLSINVTDISVGTYF